MFSWVFVTVEKMTEGSRGLPIALPLLLLLLLLDDPLVTPLTVV